MKPRKVEVGAKFREIAYGDIQTWAESKGFFNNIREINSDYFVYEDNSGKCHKKYLDTKLTAKDVKDIKAIHKRNRENVLKKAEEGDELCKWIVERLGGKANG